MLIKVEDDLFPHGATGGVCKEMDFIHDHVGQPVERTRAGINHVAQDLSGHHQDVRGGVDGNVTSEQADGVFAMRFDEIVILLIAEGLNRCGVETTCALAQR